MRRFLVGPGFFLASFFLGWEQFVDSRMLGGLRGRAKSPTLIPKDQGIDFFSSLLGDCGLQGGRWNDTQATENRRFLHFAAE